MKLKVEQRGDLVTEAAEHNSLGDIKQDITKFDIVLLHSKWSNLPRKCWSKIATDINELELCCQKDQTFREFRMPFPRVISAKISQHVCARAAHNGAICSKSRKIIVPYHRENPKTRNSAHLRSLSPLMTPKNIKKLPTYRLSLWPEEGQIITD